ncbi:MAG: RNA polymerase factor sigma-54 [Planctomycetes bacterium]|nr:RNA polymerase factor sigma-54 [Planctomycetota bacterium]
MLSQIPRQLLQQQQRLTPQLIQAMDILQLNAMALEARISQEIDGNPALELLTPEDEGAESPSSEESLSEQKAEGERDLVVQEGDASDFERLDSLVREYDWLEDDFEYRGTKSRARGQEEADLKMEAMANTTARPIGLQEHLLQDWHLVEVDERTAQLGARIIDHIDETGRLTSTLEQIAEQIQPPPTSVEMEQALHCVQQLDPPGMGARDLRECLLLQLATRPGDNELERTIIEKHFENLQKNRLPAIAKALAADLEDVKAALQVIGRLSLHPGIDFLDRQAPPIVPDVIVEYNEQEDRYEIRLTRGNMRELRISPEFRQALERSRDDKRARDFIKQKIEAANAIIDAVKYRRERLLEVAKSVVEAQRDFLDRGEQHLKVLRMSDLAARFGCDPSTISRTVDEKYMQTPRGIYPLRRFFTGGTDAGNGEALGWDSIKAKVQEIVDREDKRNPLSDDEIVTKLKELGIEIKRRTVAKYRGQLGIPTARQRRQF